MPRNIYLSGRINRAMPLGDYTFATITASIDVKKYHNQPFVLSGNVRLVQGPGTAHLWARIDRPGRKLGFSDNMDTRPIISKDWSRYEITETVDDDALEFFFGCFLNGKGKLMVDNLELKVKEEGKWKTVYSNTFESDAPGTFPPSMSGAGQPEYNTIVTAEEASEGKHSVIIESTDHFTVYKPLFARYCKPGDHIKKALGSGLSAVVPLALYGTVANTWPAGDKERLSTLKRHLENVPTTPDADIAVRTGGIIITWNVFQHFYPYFDVVEADWEMAFKTAIGESFLDQSPADYLRTLRRLTAQLKDGHANVYRAEAKVNEAYAPPIAWELIENKLVITKVGDNDLPMKPGDIVTAINDIPIEQFFEEIYSNISAATTGWLQFRANSSSLYGPANSSMIVKFLDDQNSKKQVTLRRSLTLREFHQLGEGANEPIRTAMDGIYYISKASIEQIREKFPDLEKAKAIICDLRGYPNTNHEIISHFLHENDTSKRWMRVPQIIYPDQENITGYVEMGWQMKRKKPHLGAKIFFLIDGSAISYAESFMGFIEHYNLATIVGQPSAGTNGNVNRFDIPGGYSISWTGMKVFKHDGSPLHGVGILPDVYVQKTIQGVRENRDEFLEKAIELATQYVLKTK
ncbi:MAG: S41 family peptidase [Cyclobacteriaceae bacterium]